MSGSAVSSLARVIRHAQQRRAGASLEDSAGVTHHLKAALGWIQTAASQSPAGGIPAYYDLIRNRWAPAYPETTGYAIPTLLAGGEALNDSRLHDAALALADYLLEIRTAEGAIGHWEEHDRQALVFDTGQVIFGWLAAWRATDDERYGFAVEKAARWLESVQDPSGSWLRHQYLGTAKTIDARVAWAMMEAGAALGAPRYQECARRNLDWVIEQQEDDGWFRRAAFAPDKHPVTHTIAYTIEGLLECGILLGEPRYIAAAGSAALALRQRQRPDGSLASTYGPHWRESSRSSCLTGNCQMAVIWLRLHGMRGDEAYRHAAGRALGMVAGLQDCHTTHRGVRGGIAGSYPIFGSYMRFKYPNWAAKFFADALLAWQDALAARVRTDRRFPG